MSTTMDPPQVKPLPAAAPQDDLSKYDSRRAIARAIDGVFVGAPFLIPVLGLPFGLRRGLGRDVLRSRLLLPLPPEREGRHLQRRSVVVPVRGPAGLRHGGSVPLAEVPVD